MAPQTQTPREPSASPCPPPLRIGLGHDTHRLVPGGPLRLGGIDIPFDRQLKGHSDADVLLHAVTDALLGAAALGDIGHWFPDTDEANRDRDSAQLLTACFDKVKEAGYQLINADCIIFAEEPKIGPHREAIQERISQLLDASPEQISVKAKTGERVGQVGSGEVIEAQAVALLWHHKALPGTPSA